MSKLVLKGISSFNKRIYKTSYGIALGRYNKNKNNQLELLMIKKRYTYHYFSFIFGHYKKNNNKQLQYLFNNMTFGEKIDILSMKFNSMWYRIWLSDPEKNYTMLNSYKDKPDTDDHVRNLKCYVRKKAKFEAIFMRDDGKRLRRLINNSSNSVTPWEIPKGNPNLEELNINCAMREFEEETGLYSDKYNILWDIPPITSTHIDDDVVYKSIYYIAFFKNNSSWQPKIKFETLNQLSEIEQIQWVTLDEIKFLNLNEKSKNKLIDLYKKIRHIFKINVKSYYYN